MKKLLVQFPLISRFSLAVFLCVASIVASHFIYHFIPVQKYFPFIDVASLIASTAVMQHIDKQTLKHIGLTITKSHIGFLFLGLFIGVLALGIVNWLRTIYTGEAWHLGQHIRVKDLLKGLYFILPNVIVQELMFRGYLFTKTIARLQVAKTNIIFAILFMLIHVVDRDVLHHPGQLLFLAISTPVGHLLFATGLLRTGTLLFPIGLHWGNNWAVNHLVGEANKQSVLFYTTNSKIFTSWWAFIIVLVLFNGFYLLLITAIWKWKKPSLEESKYVQSLLQPLDEDDSRHI